jgi:transcriptional regulator with XRE-family HTH domain
MHQLYEQRVGRAIAREHGLSLHEDGAFAAEVFGRIRLAMVVAGALGEAINFIQRIESGDRNVSVVEFISIAKAIGVDPCDMLRRTLR